MDSADTKPLVVGIGGTVGGPSSTEHALRIALAAAQEEGYATRLFGGEALAQLPLYDPRAREQPTPPHRRRRRDRWPRRSPRLPLRVETRSRLPPR